MIELQDHEDRSCKEANEIAERQLSEVTAKIKKLRALQSELRRITNGCDGGRNTDECYVLTSLADHAHCSTEH